MVNCVCQVNTQNGDGGAAGICRSLNQEFLHRGLASYMLVGKQKEADASTFLIDHDSYRSAWGRCWMTAAKKVSAFSGKIRGAQRFGEQIFPYIADFRRWRDYQQGREDFNFPGTENILQMIPGRPDILHLHNLHGNYFDLRALPDLSKSCTTVLTMHDLWTLTGHCAHPFDCLKWRSGCGECPDLQSPPAAIKDATRHNWERKKSIFAASRLYLAAPSQWVMDKIDNSMVRPAVALSRLIPNGVDTGTFSAGSMAESRAQLGLPINAKIIMFAANGISNSRFRDFKMMREVVRRLSHRMQGEKLLFLAIGEAAPSEIKGAEEIRCVPYVKDASLLAKYYRAADAYIHAALADVFPTVVLEALASGTPVVATAVGGIPEQIVNGSTGFLTPAGDVESMTNAVIKIFTDKPLRCLISDNASEYAKLHFSRQRMINEYLSFYEDAVEDWKINNGELPE